MAYETQFSQVIKRLDHLDKLMMEVIHLLGPSETSSVEREELFPEPAPPEGRNPWDTRVGQEEVPRLRIPYKTHSGGEAFAEWNSLDEEMQKAIEFARASDEPWQLYEDPNGGMRIVISSQVANDLRAWKLGNQIGK